MASWKRAATAFATGGLSEQGRLAQSFAGSLFPKPEDPNAELRAMEARRRAEYLKAKAAIDSQFGRFDDNYFTGISDAFMNFQRPMFDEQATAARRALPFQFSSTAGSSYQRRLEELERDIARGETSLRDQSLDAANRQRAAVEQDRSDLIRMASSGTDANATASMAAARASTLAAPPVYNPIGDLFQKFTAANLNATQMRPAGTSGFERPLLFNSGTSGSNVRTVG